MVSTPVKTSNTAIPQAPAERIYTREQVSTVVESWLIWDDTRRNDMKLVGRIGRYIVPAKAHLFWVAPAGCGASAFDFETVELAEAYLIGLHEHALRQAEELGRYVVGKYAA